MYIYIYIYTYIYIYIYIYTYIYIYIFVLSTSGVEPRKAACPGPRKGFAKGARRSNNMNNNSNNNSSNNNNNMSPFCFGGTLKKRHQPYSSSLNDSVYHRAARFQTPTVSKDVLLFLKGLPSISKDLLLSPRTSSYLQGSPSISNDRTSSYLQGPPSISKDLLL